MTPCVVNLSNKIFPIFTRLLLFFGITHVNFFLLNCDENNTFKTVSHGFSCIEIININYWTRLSILSYRYFARTAFNNCFIIIKLCFMFSAVFSSRKQGELSSESSAKHGAIACLQKLKPMRMLRALFVAEQRF